jgi:hypothetical protein
MNNYSILILFFFLFYTQELVAVKITWIGVLPNVDWNSASNWDLARVPISTDSVYTFYSDHIDLPSNFTAEIKFMKLLGFLTIPANSELIFTNGRFDALGTLNNYGTITVNNSPGVGIMCSTQASNRPFNNFGEIYINNSVFQGLVIQNQQVITNEAGALIEIENSGLESLYFGKDSGSGFLNNEGIVRMQTSGNGVGIHIKGIDSEFNNLTCGKIVVFDKIIMQNGTFNNSGFLKQDYDGDNDFGDLAITTVNNSGVLEDIFGSFDFYDFDVQSLWIKKLQYSYIKTGEEVAIFVTDTPTGINTGDIYTDNMLTTNAGSYNLASNIWIPNANANGNTTFYIRTSQQSNNCFDTVRFELDNPVIAVNYWVGGTTGSWTNAAKWSTGTVPLASERAAIYNAVDHVGINTSVNVKELYLDGQLTITATGILNITGVGTNSRIYMEGGIITNNGVIQCNNGSYGLIIRNSTVTNNNLITCIGPSASIVISSFGGLTAALINNGTIESNTGKLIDGDESIIDNQGIINAYNPVTSAIDSDGLNNSGTIYVEGDGVNGTGLSGTIHNLPTGIITLIKLEYGATIAGDNQGIITSSLNSSGFKIDGGFTNMSGGQLTVQNCEKGLFVYRGYFTNSVGGILSIDSSSQYGIYFSIPSFFYSADLENSGLITVNNTSGSGIYLQGDITNKDNGILSIKKSTAHGIHIAYKYALLKNENQGLVDVKSSLGHGILSEGGYVDNKNDGLIDIDSAGIGGIYLGIFEDPFGSHFGTITNRAQLNISSNITQNGIQSELGTTITNYECQGEIVCNRKIVLNGLFNNYGIYNHLNTGTSTIGTNINNYGVVHDPFARLLLPNTWNQGYYLGKKPGTYYEGELITNIVLKDLAITTDYELDTIWYLDKNLTLVGGAYDPVQNEFIPNGQAVDSSSFFFKVISAYCIPDRLNTLSLTFQNPINKVCGKITWEGGSGLFTNLQKWDKNRLPGVCDSIIVAGILDSVFINTSNAIVIAHISNTGYFQLSSLADMTIENNSGNAISNEGEILNKGNLTIQNTSMNGYVGLANSKLTNEGDVLIKDITFRGLTLANGEVNNKLGANFTIQNTVLENIKLLTGGVFLQKGTLLVE